MKKLFVIMLLVMGAFAANAQKTPVKTADLNKAITDNIAKDYAGFTVKEAAKVVENNVIRYDVVVAKGNTQETLCYDKDGKFLMKMAVKAGTTEKNDMKTASEPAKKTAAPAAKKN